jgi:hypothetical protein
MVTVGIPEFSPGLSLLTDPAWFPGEELSSTSALSIAEPPEYPWSVYDDISP